MAKIRRLTLFDLKKLQSLVNQIDATLPSNLVKEHDFTPFPIDVFHNMLPVNKRFLQEAFVAVEGDDLLGLIGIVPDSKERTRWTINKLILNTNAYDAGKQLIDFVVNKYGGAGVETFLTMIDDEYIEAITLFKEACLFRSCTQIQVWEFDNIKELNINSDITNFRGFNRFDAKQVHELYQQCLFPQFRHSLNKGVGDFKSSFSTLFKTKLKKYSPKKYVLSQSNNKNIEGYFSIATVNNKKYYLDIYLSLPCLEYYYDVINYASEIIRKENESATLCVYLRKYLQGANRLGEVLEELKFKCTRSQQVLVKDYWKPARLQEDEKKSPIVIFTDAANPACHVVDL